MIRGQFKAAKDLLKRAAVFAVKGVDYALVAPRFWGHFGKAVYGDYMARGDDFLWQAPRGPFAKTRRRVGAFFEASSFVFSEHLLPSLVSGGSVGVMCAWGLPLFGLDNASSNWVGTIVGTAAGDLIGYAVAKTKNAAYGTRGIDVLRDNPILPPFTPFPLADRVRQKLGLD